MTDGWRLLACSKKPWYFNTRRTGIDKSEYWGVVWIENSSGISIEAENKQLLIAIVMLSLFFI